MILNIIHYYIIFTFVLFVNGFSQSNTNFLIVENPFEIKIYNKYEQNLSPIDSTYFLPFCPIEIIAEDTLLSDVYTPAFIGKIENRSFYFLKSERNISFSNLFSLYSNYIKNAQFLMDTILVKQDNKIVFFNAKDKKQNEQLLIDTKIVRIFKKGSLTYTKNLIPPEKYGWCDLRNTKSWLIYKSPKKKNFENINQIESIIKAKLYEVNETLLKLFSHFNQINKTNNPVPHWTFVNKENEYICTLLNNENNYDFSESTNILTNEMQMILSHTSYTVSSESNEIRIHNTK